MGMGFMLNVGTQLVYESRFCSIRKQGYRTCPYRKRR